MTTIGELYEQRAPFGCRACGKRHYRAQFGEALGPLSANGGFWVNFKISGPSEGVLFHICRITGQLVPVSERKLLERDDVVEL